MKLPADQEAIRAKCFHPSGTFVKFSKEETEQSIPERFEKIVEMYSNRLAIKSIEQAFTYAELNEEANRIAYGVLDLCGEGNRPVAILMDHGAMVLAAILGVLKAGKIYVPLDPSYPLERLKYMVRDSQAELILAHRRTIFLADDVGAREFSVVAGEDLRTVSSSSNPGLMIAPEAFASILYTSGSTGQPKGVVDNHRNMLHGTLRFTNGLHISADDRISLTHSSSSSASVRRIFPALLNGASLFPLDLRKQGIEKLAALLANESITIFSTGRFRDFVRNLAQSDAFPSLRLVSLGGEVVHRRDIELLRKIFSPDCLIGIWMSTTETGNITQFFIDSKTQIAGDIVPIGYPAEDVQVILLDENGKPVNGSTIGEIAVRSRYLSCGYWRRPELTNAKFLPDPDGGQERIYLSGDLGRMETDGCLFHMGRKDDQVKVRGYRVETAEVEAALMNLGHFTHVFVTLKELSSDEKSLVAYLVPETQPAPNTSVLRKALADTLPNHMIPSSFVMLTALPLTPTGKLDRSKLPNPSMTRPELDTVFAAPRTALEKNLSAIWSEVLGLDEVGIHDNFFKLGGHSLTATRLVSQIIKQFQLEMPLQSLFQSPTVAEMAVAIVENQGKMLGEKNLENLLAELESLTEEEAQRLMNEGVAEDPKK